MTHQPCDWLDDYLAKDLSPERRREFEKHAPGCGACRSAIDEWQSMRQLLKAATEQENLPHPNLRARIAGELASREKKHWREVQWLRRGALAAACVAFIVFTQLAKNPLKRVEPNKRNQTPQATAATVLPAANLTFPDDVIGVPIDIGDPNVTVVWLYPTAPIESASN